MLTLYVACVRFLAPSARRCLRKAARGGVRWLLRGRAETRALFAELLADHADVHVRGNGARTALVIAAESGVGTSLRALLEHGANASLTDNKAPAALW